MNRVKAILTLALVFFGAAASAPAFAWHGGHFHGGPCCGFRVGVAVGGPLWWGGWGPWYYPPYYYPPAVVAPAAPAQYVEQGNAAAPAPQGYWYYCGDSKTYYPYVKECPGGWQKVTPQPAGG